MRFFPPKESGRHLEQFGLNNAIMLFLWGWSEDIGEEGWIK